MGMFHMSIVKYYVICKKKIELSCIQHPQTR